MYNLLIVDDEPEITEFLSEICSEINEYEIEIYTTCSGREALALFGRLKIDILLSDIKMPGLDGLELMKNVRESWPKCKIVFLTGYRNFDYIYTVIQNGGAKYLLKTESDSKIKEAVIESINEIENSQRQEDWLEKAKDKMKQIIPMLQEECINEIIDGLDVTSLTQERFDELSIPLLVDLPVFMFIGHFDNINISQSVSQKYEYYAILRQIVSETLSTHTVSINIIHDHYYSVWLVQPSKSFLNEGREAAFSKVLNYLRGSLEYVQAYCRKNIVKTISFSISDEPVPLNRVPAQYRILKKALACRYGIGTEMLLQESFSRDLAGTKLAAGNPMKLAFASVPGRYELLREYLAMGQKNEYFKLLHILCEELLIAKSKNYNPSLEIYYSISLILLEFINSNGISEELAFKIGLYKLTRVDEHAAWNEAVEYLMKFSEYVFEIMKNLEDKRATDVIENLKRYIKGNLAEDLTLSSLSEKVHFNSSYLSRLFKQVTHMNLSDYILDTRIDKAKQYLSDTNMKINEVAVAVGYNSPHSFARIFHRAAGMSPHEYRAASINL